MKNNLVNIQVLGTSFKIQVDEDPEHMEKILKYLKTIIDKVEVTTSINDPLKTAVLTSIFIIDELLKEKENKQDPFIEKEVSELTERIISCIDNALDE